MFAINFKRTYCGTAIVKRYYAKKACSKDATKTSGTAPAPTQKGNPRRTFKIYRFGGILSKESPKIQSFEVDISKCNMLLDVLIQIKKMDPSLTFRRSCREGICGSCGVCVQGHNCLSCITAIPPQTSITILPLPHMYVLRDLVVDMNHFIDAYNSIRPYLIRNQEIPLGTGQYAQSIKDNRKMVGLYECILCACCSTSCPSYWWNGRRFLGPAALLHAYRWVIDSRDEDTQKRLQDLRDDFKLYRCHTILNCMLACPKGLHPGMAIAKLKRMVSALEKKEFPDLEPMKFPSEASSKCK